MRGLKSGETAPDYHAVTSHPSRGAWIEMDFPATQLASGQGRTPHGVRGLKFLSAKYDGGAHGRTPHGVRGLKWQIVQRGRVRAASHPSRGAWIEIVADLRDAYNRSSRTPHGVRGLKSRRGRNAPTSIWSHPSRGAWIEMSSMPNSADTGVVAPLTGCVD